MTKTFLHALCGLLVARVSVSLKVRADRFEAALVDLRRLGSGNASESIESKDVSEEYVDVEARLRTQKRVEQQYLALLKDAKNVGETLEVHKPLTIVRTEIERLEGRQRLLEHQVRLSTISATLLLPAVVVLRWASRRYQRRTLVAS